jgi:ketosteroid isomerase-like protein
VAHPNEALVEQIHGSFASGQHPSVNLFAPDVIWHVEGANPLAREYRGRDAVFHAFRVFESKSGGTLRVRLVSVTANDEYALAVLHANGSREDRSYDCLEYDVYRIAYGAIAEFWSFSSNQRATDAFWLQALEVTTESMTGRGQQESEKEHYAWAQYQADIERLADEIRSDSRHSLTTIYGIARGGLVVAVSLSQILGLPIVLSAEKITPATLVVDDIADSGKTLDNICRRIGFRPMVVTLYYNPSSVLRPDKFIRTKTKWVVFPWETELSSRYDQAGA